MRRYDAVVVGAGPNGLSAAVELARAGWSVLVREAEEMIGGGARSWDLTLPGFVHDPFSAVYPLGVGSPFFRELPLAEHGLEWVHSPAALAHPFDDGRVALLERSIEATGATLGRDAEPYRRLIEPLVRDWDRLLPDLLAPLRVPHHPLLLARFGLKGLRSVKGLVGDRFPEGRASALFGGSAGHVGLPLDQPATAAYGLVLNAAGHTVGWPIPRGGAGRITQALASYLRSLGGEIETGAPVRSLEELPPARATLLDLTPRQILKVAGDRLPPRYRARLERFRYGIGVFKMDWALSGPIPWRSPECARSATVHLVGSFEELLRSEHGPWHGEHPERPLVLLAQPTLFDPSRAPEGKHVAWAYCHVPLGSTLDMTERVEAQIERFAPGFRDLVLARRAFDTRALQAMNANFVEGDINGGAGTLGQIFFRPAPRLSPYATDVEGLFICSASTPPSGGVHGMCGFHAARAVLAELG